MASLGNKLYLAGDVQKRDSSTLGSLERNISVCMQVFARHAEKGAQESGACNSAPEWTSRGAPEQGGAGAQDSAEGRGN